MKLPSIFSGNRTIIFFRLVVNGMAQASTTIGTILLVRMAFDRFIIKSQDIQFSLMLQVGLGLVFIAICIGWLRMVERIDAEKVGQ
ncbi:MAG: ABC transporter ATP-binding protein, partial [Thermodesulfobacteriota bacterium]|nr:ABC transporter ATP-binding protein [Thermodesulfobacteriota bacterium]